MVPQGLGVGAGCACVHKNKTQSRTAVKVVKVDLIQDGGDRGKETSL